MTNARFVQIATAQRDEKVQGAAGYRYASTPVLYALDGNGIVWRYESGVWAKLSMIQKIEPDDLSQGGRL